MKNTFSLIFNVFKKDNVFIQTIFQNLNLIFKRCQQQAKCLASGIQSIHNINKVFYVYQYSNLEFWYPTHSAKSLIHACVEVGKYLPINRNIKITEKEKISGKNTKKSANAFKVSMANSNTKILINKHRQGGST